jgi:hypothetical protein
MGIATSMRADYRMKTKKERIYKNVPQECNMPDISDLDAPLKNRLMVVLVGFSDKGLTQICV